MEPMDAQESIPRPAVGDQPVVPTPAHIPGGGTGPPSTGSGLASNKSSQPGTAAGSNAAEPGAVPLGEKEGDAAGTDVNKGALLPENPEDTRCYCGTDRDLNVPEFQCGMCLRFYHAKCIQCTVGDCVPFMTNYQFFCKRCSVSESFNKRPASFSQMCLTGLANLQQQTNQKFFSRDKEIIPYIDVNWENLTTGPRKVKQTWHTTIAKTMMKDAAIFQYKDDDEGETIFGLMDLDLTKIGPNCESLFRLTNASYRSAEIQKSTSGDNKGRPAKRKGPTDGPVIKHKRGDVTSTKMAPKAYPQEHPYNKDGYRYILAEPDPHAPNWQAYDESIEWAGKPIPPYLYRTYLEKRVLLAMHDRAPQLKFSDDRLSVTGEKGYSMVRATHGVSHGVWYYEVNITNMPADSATRIGWSQKLGNLQAPCGYDKFSYSWRSRKGTVFHQSRGKHYSSGYKTGDVLGMLIFLPYPQNPEKLTPEVYKDKPLVKFKSLLYYEEKDYVSETASALKPAKGSKIVFLKNGKCHGIAYSDVFEGTYYPAISLFKNTMVRANFGPKFKYPPGKIAKPLSDIVEESHIQYAMGDILYHIEHEGKLPEF